MSKRLLQLGLLFAVDKNNVIGKNNDIPWRSSHDYRWFKATTLGYNAIMGRLTWESLPVRPLKGRTNYVISSNPNYDAPGAIVVTSLEAALEQCQQQDLHRPIYVIGGKRVLEEAAQYATRAYISRISVETEVDETCVMAPELPPYENMGSYLLFAGNENEPAVQVETIRFLD